MSRAAQKALKRQPIALQDLEKTLCALAYGYSLHAVWHDWCAMTAIALSNAVDWRQREPREAEYMHLIKRYKTLEERLQFPKLNGQLALLMEQHGMRDYLGPLFHALELQNHWAGQFFTPWEVAECMARMTMHDAKALFEQKEFVRVQEPCVGAGVMVIALAHWLKEESINYQQRLYVEAVDVDITAVHMSYIQFALYHIPAVVYHGNSLSGEMWSAWVTPAYIMGLWGAKLRRVARTETECLEAPPPSPKRREEPPATPEPEPLQEVHTSLPAIGGQLRLF